MYLFIYSIKVHFLFVCVRRIVQCNKGQVQNAFRLFKEFNLINYVCNVQKKHRIVQGNWMYYFGGVLVIDLTLNTFLHIFV